MTKREKLIAFLPFRSSAQSSPLRLLNKCRCDLSVHEGLSSVGAGLATCAKSSTGSSLTLPLWNPTNVFKFQETSALKEHFASTFLHPHPFAILCFIGTI